MSRRILAASAWLPSVVDFNNGHSGQVHAVDQVLLSIAVHAVVHGYDDNVFPWSARFPLWCRYVLIFFTASEAQGEN